MDAGLSSLATFLTGLAAARYFPTPLLGAYALAVTAAAVAIAVPSSAIFASIERDNGILAAGRKRLLVLPHSVWRGLTVAAPSGIGACILFLAVVPHSIALSDRLDLAVTAACFTAISPVQDHARRVLHQAESSYAAAAVSGLQLAVVLVVELCALTFQRAGSAAVPLLALSVANVSSLALAMLIGRHRRPSDEVSVVLTSARHCFLAGRALLASTLVGFGSGFGLFAIVTAGSGPTATGEAEAARLVAQPVTLVLVGAVAVLAADLLSAVASGDQRKVGNILRIFFIAAFFLTGSWVLISWPSWSWSPLPKTLPTAYRQSVPLLLIILGQAVSYASLIFVQIALAARRNRFYATATGVTAVLGLLLAIVMRHSGEAAVAAVGLFEAVLNMLIGCAVYRQASGGTVSTALRCEDTAV